MILFDHSHHILAGNYSGKLIRGAVPVNSYFYSRYVHIYGNKLNKYCSFVVSTGNTTTYLYTSRLFISANVADTILSVGVGILSCTVLGIVTETAIMPMIFSVTHPVTIRHGYMGFYHITVYFSHVIHKSGIAYTCVIIPAGASCHHYSRCAACIASDLIKHIETLFAVVVNAEAGAAIHAEVILVLGIFHAHSVNTFGIISAAILAESAGIADITAGIATLLAFLAYYGAIGAMIATEAKVVAGTAVVTVVTPQSACTVHTASAFLAEAVAVAVIADLTAHGTHGNTIFTSHSATLTDYCTVTAESAILAVSKSFHRTIVAFTAIVAGCFAVALCTVTFAERAYTCTTGARFSAINADHFAISAHSAVFAPAAVLNTVSAISAVLAPSIAFFCAFLANVAAFTEVSAIFAHFLAH